MLQAVAAAGVVFEENVEPQLARGGEFIGNLYESRG
jgi:hypothetical protein